MRSIFRDHTNDFFDILTYPKEKWEDYWKKYQKKYSEIVKEYFTKNNLSADEFLLQLNNTERRFIDKAYWYKEEIIESVKNNVVHMLTNNAKKYKLDRNDYAIKILCFLGEKPYYYIDTYKKTIIAIDFIYFYMNKDISLEKIIEEAILKYIENTENDERKGFFWIMYDDLKTIIKNNKNDKETAFYKIAEYLDKKVSYYNWTGFYLVDEEQSNYLKVGPYVGEKTDHLKIKFGEGICGQAASTEKTFVIGDVSKETNYLSCSSKTKSEIVVPIFDSENNIVGEIDIDSHYINPFDEKDKLFLEDLSKLITKYFYNNK